MQILSKKYKEHPKVKELLKLLSSNEQVQVSNAISSARSFFVSSFYHKINKPLLISLSDEEDAAYFYNDLQSLLPTERVFFFPATVRHLTHQSGIKADKAAIMMRTETMTQINKTTNPVIVTYPSALAETVISADEIAGTTIDLAVGESVETEFLVEMFFDFGFVKTDFVFEPGQFAIRGGIVDVFSFSAQYPYRIDFFGDEVDSIRIFDIETQLSIKKIDKVSIVNNIQIKSEKNRISFLEFIDNQTVIFIENKDFHIDIIKNLYEKEKEITFLNNETEKNETVELINPELFQKKLTDYKIVHFFNNYHETEIPVIKLNITPQVSFQKQFNLLANDLKNKQNEGFKTYILSKSPKQLERLKDILLSDEVLQHVRFEPIEGIVHEGFSDKDINVSIYTDHQIFERYHRFMLRSFITNKSKEVQLIKEIKELKRDDFIVHIDFGIGVFKGLTTIENNGKKQEVVRIEYKDKDNLFVNVHALHKISKYKNQDSTAPQIHKLGSVVWQNRKKKTKKHIKDIAKDLIQLYAKRIQERGFACEDDNYLQEALEASFIYEETADQLTAITDVKADMQKDIPMDRLICGDVGFGKTEIAVRAAFKAVANNKQVALLCPTTILAYQHYRTFSQRLKDLPVTVDYISRMKTPKQQREIINKLITKKIDIIIGTHRLISKDVKFADLGLLVIDEEQKFGVSVKEKLKQMRTNVDCLTLSATPIPRTLQFSLMGARDLSVLQTPPQNRQPIITELHTMNKAIVAKSINYEVRRGGQVFFVHNHVATLPKIKHYINEILPDVSVDIVHGQMKVGDIEKVITHFINGDFDVLLTTTIIENGLDIPNANTIIINNAHHFGLSDLHQLRGRVGRSSRKAFCYLFAPPKSLLKDIARRRLTAIENFVELGSGFNIALQDLDIRGAGDLLGAEQSGFINDIGYETFKRILEETMLELKTTEYKDIFADQNKNDGSYENNFVNDCQITTDLDIGFYDNYIENDSERLKLYHELDNIKSEEALVTFEKALEDRFGKMTFQAQELISVMKMRLLAIMLAVEKIIIKDKVLLLIFVSDPNSAFYDSEIFKVKILGFVMKNQGLCSMKQKNDRLTLRFNNIKSVKNALEMLQKIIDF